MQANVWSTRKIEIILSYIKIRVIRPEGESNRLLVVNCLGRYSQLDSQEPQQVKHEEEEQPKDEPIRSKSPFRAFVHRKKSGPITQPQSNKINVADERLPQFIARNGLLVGSYASSVITVPPPEPNINSHLCFIDNQFQWCEIENSKKVNWKI